MRNLMKIGTTLFLSPVLLLATFPAAAQYDRGQYDRNDRNAQYQRHDYDRRVNRNYYSGMRDGGRGGNYDRNDHERYPQGYNGYYRDGAHRQDDGIGPGKGAAIGAAGGAILGALFGGGLKGVVIGGAAGAGVGAIAGKAAQNNRRDQDGRYRDNY